MLEFLKKIIKSPIIKNLLLAVIVVFVVLIGVSFYLKIYTHHNQKMFTPSFRGMQIDEAMKLAQEKGVKIKIIDSIYTPYANPGEILDQTPKANFLIKKGRTIFVSIRSFKQKTTKVPDLHYKSLVQARAELETAGLRIGEIKYRESTYNNLVLEQLSNGKIIKPGTEVPEATKIDLIVGRQGNEQAVVPELEGLTLKDAEFKAAEYSLNIGNISFDPNVITKADSLNATVYKQSIAPGTSVSQGTHIDIKLGLN